MLASVSAATGNIAASYNAATGVLTLTSAGGTATIAQWTAALQSVTYANAALNAGSSRTVTFTVNDGVKSSAAASNTIAITNAPAFPPILPSAPPTIIVPPAASHSSLFSDDSSEPPDVLDEFDYSELYAPVDLGIGHCRISVAEPAALAASDDPRERSHVRVATKYPSLTRRHFESRGVQAECVKLNGSMELAPLLGLAPRIVDLVSSGRTLKENGLVEVEVIAEVSARLIVNRAAFKMRAAQVAPLVEAFRAAVK